MYKIDKNKCTLGLMGGAGMTGTGTVSALPTVLGPVLPTPQMPMHPQVIHFISFSNLTNHFF